MFIEPNNSGERKGSIEVICGSMFSGKTEELIRRLKRVRIANQRIAVFKPFIDNRYAEEKIVSHDTNFFDSIPIRISKEIFNKIENVDVVGIDEAQFFDPEIADCCDLLAFRGIRVIVAGLDMDYLGKPFGPMPQILAKADYVTKLHAICQQCGGIANYSYRKVANEEQVMLGATDSYEARCRKCYQQS
ncbi:MAG: thymidine kinase [Bacteroidetes bacterium]|nr:thymidine kinase [Bacteroidota bacterium]